MIEEQYRLDEVQRYDVLDTGREEVFDRLAEVAACACGTPIAFISFIDAQRVWHKAEHGATLGEIARVGSLFADALVGPVLIVEDTQAHPRFAGDPAMSAMAVRFCAGAPLTTPRGLALGTLCVLDQKPRQFSVESVRALLLIRDEIMRVLEDRRELAELRRSEALRQEAVEALVATKADLEQRIALRTRQVVEAHAKIKSILHRVADGFVALDREWRFTYVNERTHKTFGADPVKLIGKNIWQEYPNIVGQAFHQACERAMRDQEPVTLSDYVAEMDRWFEDRIYPSPDGLTIFFTETTQRRRVERALEDTARRLAEAQAVAHVGSWEWSVAQNRVLWSEEMHHIYGTTPDSFDGSYEGFLKRVHPDDQPHTVAVVSDAAKTPKRFVYDHRIVRSDGGVRMLHTVGESLGADGRVERMVGSCWDTTEQWQASLDLDQTRALVQVLLASVGDGVLIVGADRRIAGVSEACARMFEIPPALATVGAPAAPLLAHIAARLGAGVVLPPDGEDPFDGALRLADGTPVELRLRPFRADGRPAGRVWTFLR